MVKSKILYSRRIIGWAYDTSMTAELAVKAVRNACIESFHSLLKKKKCIVKRIRIQKTPIRVSSNISSHGTVTGESIVALAIRPRMKCMRGVWHKRRNFMCPLIYTNTSRSKRELLN